MSEILLFGAMLSLMHAAIPNHWIPVVVLGRSYDWGRLKTLSIAALCGGAHVSSTIIIGVGIGLLGQTLGHLGDIISQWVAPGILAGLGLVLILLDITGKSHHHGHCHGPMDHHDQEHDHDHGHQHPKHDTAENTQDGRAAIATITLAMFLSPCLELEAYFLRAGELGWAGILALAGTYLLVTVSGIMLLVLLFSAGYQRVRWRFLEYHERLVSGIVLILAGIGAFALNMPHGH